MLNAIHTSVPMYFSIYDIFDNSFQKLLREHYSSLFTNHSKLQAIKHTISVVSVWESDTILRIA